MGFRKPLGIAQSNRTLCSNSTTLALWQGRADDAAGGIDSASGTPHHRFITRRTTRGENPSELPPEARGSESRVSTAKKLDAPPPDPRSPSIGSPGRAYPDKHTTRFCDCSRTRRPAVHGIPHGGRAGNVLRCAVWQRILADQWSGRNHTRHMLQLKWAWQEERADTWNQTPDWSVILTHSAGQR
jgi:hypothetical protein